MTEVRSNPVLSAVRRSAKLPLVRRLSTARPVAYMARPLRGSLVQESRSFAGAELRGCRGIGSYHLRDSEVMICLRHGSTDVFALDEVFAQRPYDLPAWAKAILDAEQAPRVLDLGANIGLFGAYVIQRYPGANILGFEPDPDNARVHRLCIEANDRSSSWELIEACAATRAGNVSFRAGGGAISQITGDDNPLATRVEMVDVFEHLDGADLLKIDIEGAEWELLADARFAGVDAPVLVLEYHDHLCPTGDSRQAAVDLLEASGYEVTEIYFERPDEQAGMLWARRRSNGA